MINFIFLALYWCICNLVIVGASVLRHWFEVSSYVLNLCYVIKWYFKRSPRKWVKQFAIVSVRYFLFQHRQPSLLFQQPCRIKLCLSRALYDLYTSSSIRNHHADYLKNCVLYLLTKISALVWSVISMLVGI